MDRDNFRFKVILEAAENPKNEIEKIISQNKEFLHIISDKDLGSIFILRMTGKRLCNLIPYSREDIASLIENEEVSPYDKVAELENTFLILEHIFSKYNGKEY